MAHYSSRFRRLATSRTRQWSAPSSAPVCNRVREHTRSRRFASSLASSLRIARCPKATSETFTPLECRFCSKPFALERALVLHEATHRTHGFSCDICLRRFEQKHALKSHMATHDSRPRHVCLSCGSEFLHESTLRAHEEREPPEHEASRPNIDFDDIDEIYDSFSHPEPVTNNSLYHVTDRRSAHQIFRSLRFQPGKHSDRPHDGAARRDDAPELAYFSLASGERDKTPEVTFHPVYAEPGELGTSLFFELDAFLNHPDDFRLYLLHCVPMSERIRAPVRVTLLFAPRRDWSWCEAQGLHQLDFSNPKSPLFHEPDATARHHRSGSSRHSASSVWRAATRLLTPQLGWRRLKVVVAVAGGIDLQRARKSASMDMSSSALRWFDVAHVFSDAGQPRCPTCLETFAHYEDLFTHLQGPKSFSCAHSTCERTFSTPQTRDAHEREHVGDLLFECSSAECDRAFKSAFECRTHELSHSDDRSFACSHDGCDKRFKTCSAVKQHELIHTESRDYECEVGGCAKRFKTRRAKLAHEARHSPESVFECQHSGCLSQFKDFEALRDHLRLHSGHQPYVCSICSHAFSNRASLWLHSTSHSEARAYVCSLCMRSYKYSSDLRAHERTHEQQSTSDSRKEERQRERVHAVLSSV